jgi:hypothetical protein
MGQKSVGEFPLGYDLGRLVGSNRSVTGTVAGGEGLLAYMLLAYEPCFIVDLVLFSPLIGFESYPLIEG